jgi:hypothetical protein
VNPIDEPLCSWANAEKKNLKYVYIIHAHGNIAIFSILGLDQYTVGSTISIFVPSSLRSPKISGHIACFTFQYFVHFSHFFSIDSRMYVFIRVTNNSQWLQSWSENLEKERGKWRTINILLYNESGFNQVNRLFVNILLEYEYIQIESL